GVAGSLAGLASGIILARGLTQLVTRTINDLYFVLSVRELAIPPWILVKGAALGLGATVLASLPPAVEATTAPPRAVLSRSAIAATLAVGIMVESFRTTVERWLETTLQADVYVSAPGSVGGRPAAPLPPALIARLAAVAGVGRVSTHRSVTVESPAGSTRLVV